MSSRARVWIALFAPLVLLAIVFSCFAAYFSNTQGLHGDDVAKAIERVAWLPTSIGFIAAFLVTCFLARRDGLSLRDIGWTTPTPMDVVIGLGAAATLVVLNAWILHPLVQRAQPSFDPTLSILNLPAAMVMMAIAVVAEDTLFRGYAFKVLRERHGAVLAVVVTTLFYAPLGGGQGWPLKVWALYFGVVLCALRLWRGNLWSGAIAHWLVALTPKLLAAV